MPLNPGYSTVIAPTLITPRQPDLTRVIACDMPCRTLVIAGKHLAMSLNAPRTLSVELTRTPAPFAAVHCGPPTHERKSVRHVDVASRPPHDRGRRAQPHAGGCRALQPLGHDRAAAALSLTLAGAALASPSATIEQVRNGLASSTTTPTPSWVSGNAGGSNSHYLESHSIPYRAVMTQLPTNGTVIELTVGYAVKKSGSYAIDYLTQFQRVLPHVLFAHKDAEVFDPLNGVVGVGSTVSTAAIPIPTTNLVVDPDGAGPESPAAEPSTSMWALSAAERVMTLYGANLIDGSYVTQGDVSLATSTSESQIKIRFTATSPTADTSMML